MSLLSKPSMKKAAWRSIHHAGVGALYQLPDWLGMLFVAMIAVLLAWAIFLW